MTELDFTDDTDDIDILKKDLRQAISDLREGYGCIGKIRESSDIHDLMHSKSSDTAEYMASRFLKLVQTLMPGPEGEILLAALNLLEGYGRFGSPDERRLRYHLECKPDDVDVKNNTLYKKENAIIKTLVDRIVTSDVIEIIKDAPKILTVPKPRYTQKLDGVLDINLINKHTKMIPSVADGVDIANTKLDELAKLSAVANKFDNMIDAQVSGAMNAIVYSLLGKNITGVEPALYELIAKCVKDDIDSHFEKAIVARLPNKTIDEIDRLLDDGVSEDTLSDFFQKKLIEHKVDFNTIYFNTIMRYIESYEQRYKTTEKTQNLPELELLTSEKIDALTNAQVDEGIEALITYLERQYPKIFTDAHMIYLWGITDIVIRLIHEDKLGDAVKKMEKIIYNDREFAKNDAFVNLKDLVWAKHSRSNAKEDPSPVTEVIVTPHPDVAKRGFDDIGDLTADDFKNMDDDQVQDWLDKLLELDVASPDPILAAYKAAMKKYSVDGLRERYAHEFYSSNGVNTTTPQAFMSHLLNEFIDALIGNNADNMRKREYDELRKNIAAEVENAYVRSLLDALPDVALAVVDAVIGSNADHIAITAEISKQTLKYNIDTIEIISNVFTNMLDIYNPSISGTTIFIDEE